ncbi:MAG: hypothetical protein QNJ72_33975 [Pleurocapsa sp. MO_226.B13]|nr:hypothetical protein [Pleurocapsa sp. MO_226.B13]
MNKVNLLALVTFVALLGTSLSSSLEAQEISGDPDIEQEYLQERLELTRSAIQADRKAIVNEYMDLTEEESQDFWPLYKEYRTQATKLNDRLAKIILDYGDSYQEQSVSDEQAEQMLSDYLILEQDRLDLRDDYVAKFQQILPPIKVTRYFQLENKLDAIVDYDLAGNIPLVE